MSEHDPVSEASAPFFSELVEIVGSEHVLRDADMIAGQLVDWTGRFRGHSPAVVRPATTDEVVEIVTVCRAHSVALTPQGGNTGLVGGGVPLAGEVVLDLRRLDRLGPVDPIAGQVTAGAGVTIGALAEHVARAGWRYAVDFGARDSATVGGTIATNAGGHPRAAVRDDPPPGARPDRRPRDWCGGLPSRRARQGQHRLRPGGAALRQRRHAGRRHRGPAAARAPAHLGRHRPGRLRRARRGGRRGGRAPPRGPVPRGRRVRPGRRCTLVDGLGRGSSPFARCPRCSSSPRPPVATIRPTSWRPRWARPRRSRVAVASDDRRRAELWHWREAHTEAINTLGPPHKLDVTLPMGALAEFFDGGSDRPSPRPDRARRPGSSVTSVTATSTSTSPVAPDDDEVDEAVVDLVAALGGSISAEHGIGTAKKRWLSQSGPRPS